MSNALPLTSAWSVVATPVPTGASSLNVAELLGALSHALDLTEGQPKGHCQRACWIGTQVGMQMGLTAEALSDIYFTALLKDLGCSSNAARICELYLADDISFKRDFKTIDGSLSAALRFVMDKTGIQSGFAERVRAILNILRNGGEISRELIETRCHRGADIAAKMRFSAKVQDGIRWLDEHWDGSGKPEGRVGEEIPMASRIALVAQVADIFHKEGGRAAARAEIAARRGTWFDPAVVDTFLVAERQPLFWDAIESDGLGLHLSELTPARSSAPLDDDYVDDIAAAFADVIDAKSPFTAGHSRRVTLFTDMIAEEMGVDAGRRRWLRRAALLHDIGKLAVSNQILDKPGRPEESEWVSIRSHPAHSADILRQVAIFRDIAEIAGAHHERLDGKGYPLGLAGDAIVAEVRMLTVADVFDALTADRPYRRAMKVEEAFAIIDKDIGSAFDEACVLALKRAVARLAGNTQSELPSLRWA
ncbi:MAG: HD domain-containing protein [Mesorhizobium sp.]|nr:HD domain-containing phosphohydrolase [Mesorhizobium sp.]MCO5163634.1 HD domain-containing protein [Mesorhizobium sp.]